MFSAIHDIAREWYVDPTRRAEFTRLLASRLAPGGYIHFATDWEEYAEQALAVLSETKGLANAGDGFVTRPSARPRTRFEERGIKLGHVVRDLRFIKETRT